MFETLFKPNTDAHLKRAKQMLQEAQMARVEHQAAAEHHGALAQMYAERISRLEREIDMSRPLPWRDALADGPLAPEAMGSEKVRHYPFGDRRLERP